MNGEGELPGQTGPYGGNWTFSYDASPRCVSSVDLATGPVFDIDCRPPSPPTPLSRVPDFYPQRVTGETSRSFLYGGAAWLGSALG
jgi:hypothetical protein